MASRVPAPLTSSRRVWLQSLRGNALPGPTQAATNCSSQRLYRASRHYPASWLFRTFWSYAGQQQGAMQCEPSTCTPYSLPRMSGLSHPRIVLRGCVLLGHHRAAYPARVCAADLPGRRLSCGLRDIGLTEKKATSGSRVPGWRHRGRAFCGRPGYWGWGGGFYAWHGGYWGEHVGYYGGVNYGYGYGGEGFYGGRWEGNRFAYNAAVLHVDRTVVHNTYIDNTVIHNTTVINRTSYNGPGGLQARPTASRTGKPCTSRHIQPTSAAAGLARTTCCHQPGKLRFRQRWETGECGG